MDGCRLYGARQKKPGVQDGVEVSMFRRYEFVGFKYSLEEDEAGRAIAVSIEIYFRQDDILETIQILFIKKEILFFDKLKFLNFYLSKIFKS